MQVNLDDQIEDFINSLEKQTIAKVLRTIDLLEKFGNRLGMPHSKYILDGIFELRIHSDQEIRIFFCFYQNSAYLLHGFIKKTQKTPAKEILAAKNKFRALTHYNL